MARQFQSAGLWRRIDKLKAKMDEAQIEEIFTYHTPTEGQPEKYVEIRAKAKELALLYLKHCPQSREASVALTNLQSSVQMANAAIAIHS